MNLTLVREVLDDVSTIGRLYVDGVEECFTLEDADRKLEQYLPDLAKLAAAKIYGKTCIPRGSYEVACTWSNKFGRIMPLVVNVPGYDGIRIHPGNTDADTLGCILVGQVKQQDKILNSRLAFDALFPKIQGACATSKVLLEIT